jgi:hypothetical protein
MRWLNGNIDNNEIWKRIFWELYNGNAKVIIESSYLIPTFLYLLSCFNDLKRNSDIYIKKINFSIKSVEFVIKYNGVYVYLYVYQNNKTKKLLWSYLDSGMYIFDKKFIEIQKDIYNRYQIKLYEVKETILKQNGG